MKVRKDNYFSWSSWVFFIVDNRSFLINVVLNEFYFGNIFFFYVKKF